MTFRILTLLAIMASSSMSFAAYTKFSDLTEGTEYVDLFPGEQEGQPFSASDDEVEVAFVFQYSCNHCFSFYSNQFARMKAQLAQQSNIELVKVPAVWGGTSEFEAQLYWSLNVTGQQSDQADQSIYHAMHVQRIPLRQLEQSREFLQLNGFNYARISRAYNSFKVRNFVNRSRKSVRAWKVRGTPTLIVDGRYQVAVRRGMTHRDMADIAIILAKSLARNKLPAGEEFPRPPGATGDAVQ